MIMLKTQKIGKLLSGASLWLGLVAIPLWMLSYVWIPFRFAGLESESVWAVVVGSELAAIATGSLSIAAGLVALWIHEKESAEARRARFGTILGATAWICIVLFNLIGIFFFS